MLRFPGLLASVMAGALLLAGVAAAHPLFLSATAGVLVDKHLADVNRYAAGYLIQETTGFLAARHGETGEPPLFSRRTAVFAQTAADTGQLEEPVVTMMSEPLEIRAAEGERRRQVRLLARTDVLDNITIVATGGSGDAWVPDLVARYLRIADGGDVEILRIGARRGVRVEVAGTYRALYNEPRTPYWSGLEQRIYPPNPDSSAPPPFVVVDRAEFLRVTGALEQETAFFRWEAPVVEGALTLEDARRLASAREEFARALSDPSTEAGKAFRCTDCHFANEPPRLSSEIGGVVHEVERRLAAVEGPAQVVLSAGIIVALCVLAAAGIFVVATRPTETGLLFARGTSPLAFALKNALEKVVPAALGAGAGFFTVRALVESIGPAGPVGEDAVNSAMVLSAAAVPISVTLSAVVAGGAFARFGEQRRRSPSWIARAPWELALVALAGLVLFKLNDGGALVTDAVEGVDRPSLALLAFPFLAIGSLSVLAGRIARAGLRRLRGRTGRGSEARYLAVRRLAGARRVAPLLFVAAAVALGTFVHAQTIVRSLESTVDAKSKLFVGSDVQTTMNYSDQVPDDFAFPATRVSHAADAGSLEGVAPAVDVLGIDPDTFARAAYWDPSFADRSLTDLLEEIRDRGEGPMRALLANGDFVATSRLTSRGRAAPVEIVAVTTTFPGVSSLRPMLVVDRSTMERFFTSANPLEPSPATTQFWIRGDPNAIEDAVAALDPPPYYSIRVDEVKDVPSIGAVIDTFSVLQILGIAAGLLAVVAVLMYLQARQRARVVSHGLARRMGLTRSAHRRALLMELAGLLVVSYLVGVLTGVASAGAIVRLIDPLKTIPPPPLFAPPIVSAIATFIALVIVCAVAARITDARTARTNLAEVMRVAN